MIPFHRMNIQAVRRELLGYNQMYPKIIVGVNGSLSIIYLVSGLGEGEFEYCFNL